MIESVRIFNQALSANNGEPLKAAKALVDTMFTYPDTRSNDVVEAVAALLREGLLAPVVYSGGPSAL